MIDDHSYLIFPTKNVILLNNFNYMIRFVHVCVNEKRWTKIELLEKDNKEKEGR